MKKIIQMIKSRDEEMQQLGLIFLLKYFNINSDEWAECMPLDTNDYRYPDIEKIYCSGEHLVCIPRSFNLPIRMFHNIPDAKMSCAINGITYINLDDYDNEEDAGLY